MDPGLFRAALFVGVVFLVFAAAALEATLRVAEAAGLRKTVPGPARRRVRMVLFAVAGLGVLCILYGRFVEPFWPEVTFHRVAQARVPAGERIRIVHLTDLHCDPTKRIEDRIPGLVAAEKPDLIVYTGDCLNHRDGLPHFREVMTALARIAPVYAVRGNWDCWYWKDLDLFGGTGVTVLEGESRRLQVRGTALRIGGLPYDRNRSFAETLAGRADDEVVLFLYHTPDLVFDLAREGVDMAFAGHTHGGQVALPWYGAVVTLSAFDKAFERGLHRVGSTWQYTGRGIGMEGGAAPRVRFCARPEIAVLDLVAPGDGADEVVDQGVVAGGGR